MLTYRLAGVLLFLSGFVTGIGHVVALMSWRGLYSFTDNRISDMTVTECQILRDNLGTRYVCNPAFMLTNGAYVVAGFLIVAAAGVMWLAAGREKHSSVRMASVLVGGAGAVSMLAGIFPYNISPAVHDISKLVFAILVWVFMAFLAGVGSARSARGRSPHPLIYGAYLPITRLMLIASVVGMILLLLLGPRGFPGAYERLAFDTLTIWLMVIGICMYSLGGAADQESQRVAEMEAAGVVVGREGGRARRYPGFATGWGRRRQSGEKGER